MPFTIKPTLANLRWVKAEIKSKARKLEMNALDRWVTDGGSYADEVTAKPKKRLLVYRIQLRDLLQRFN